MNKKVQYFNGVHFVRDDNTGYYLNSTIHKRMHRYVWEYYNGVIPKGYDIHHKDHDKGNNNILNLEMIDKKSHVSMHGKEYNLENHDKMVKRINYARKFASAWHGTKNGAEWHKKHFAETKDAMFKNETMICNYCGKQFQGINHGTENHFCSNKCKSAYRRKTGVDDEIRECEYCGKEFISSKYSKRRTCSRTCFNKINKGEKHKADRTA